MPSHVPEWTHPPAQQSLWLANKWRRPSSLSNSALDAALLVCYSDFTKVKKARASFGQEAGWTPHPVVHAVVKKANYDFVRNQTPNFPLMLSKRSHRIVWIIELHECTAFRLQRDPQCWPHATIQIPPEATVVQRTSGHSAVEQRSSVIPLIGASHAAQTNVSRV